MSPHHWVVHASFVDHSEYRTKIRKKVRHRRESLHLTPEQLSLRAGLAVSVVIDLEAGDRPVDSLVMLKLAQGLDVQLPWFFEV